MVTSCMHACNYHCMACALYHIIYKFGPTLKLQTHIGSYLAMKAALYKLLVVCFFLWFLAQTVSVRGETWTRIPGPQYGVLESVTVTTNHLWGIDSRVGMDLTPSDNNVVYCRRPCSDGNWIDAAGQLDQIDAKADEVWGINDRNQVYRRASGVQIGMWLRVGGTGNMECKESDTIICISDISVSSDGEFIWGVSTRNLTYMSLCQNCNSLNWILINDTKVSITQIDAGSEEVWGVNATNYIFRRPVNGSGEWTIVPGRMRYVSASGNKHIWGIAPNDYLYNCKKPCTGDWKYVGGCFKQIDAGDNFVCGIVTNNTVLAFSTANNHEKGMRLTVAVRT